MSSVCKKSKRFRSYQSSYQFVEVKFDYSKTKNHGTGEFVLASKVISAADGRVWSFFFYPSGANPRNRSGRGEYISLSAVSLGNRPTNAAAVRAIFTAVVVRTTTDIAAGAPPSSSPAVHARCSSEVIHHPATSAAADAAFIGLFKFMKRSDVETGGFLGDDGCVKFLCGIVSLDAADDRISVPASDLGTHLGNHLLEQNRAAAADGGGGGGSSSTTSWDVSFSVGDKAFRAHRAILAARSPVFRAQLLGGMEDAKMDRITLHGVRPAAFGILLWFVYTDDEAALAAALPARDDGVAGDEMLRDLLAAADMYHLERMKLVCAQKLWDRVSVSTLAATLGCAETHGCPELKRRCIDFLIVDENLKKVALTEGYLQLMQCFPSVIDEIRASEQQPR